MEVNEVNFEELKGKTLTNVVGLDEESPEAIWFCSDGTQYRMWHWQSCCEMVSINDVIGDVEDLIGSPILLAEEVSNKTDPHGQEYEPESYTWTFYKLSTIKGSVTIRWYGESNGYYSESVSFERTTK